MTITSLLWKLIFNPDSNSKQASMNLRLVTRNSGLRWLCRLHIVGETLLRG
jgi:hypothetical protein